MQEKEMVENFLPRLSVVGLGKLGAPMAAVLASKGFEVVGVDLEPRHVEAINAGKAPVVEPQLEQYIAAAGHRLRATHDYRDAVHNSDISFIIVPTPTGADGAFSNRFVLSAVTEIGKALRTKDGFHNVVITSTVMPGSTNGEIRKTLEEHSARKVGVDLGLCYSPEFIALGSVIHDMLNPDFVLIGESDPDSGAMLERVYRRVCENAPSFRRMNLINAEICKIAVNTFITTKISFANMLAEMCERLDGADVDVVCAAAGTDSRIGRKYFRGTIGYGGPCFPRDNRAFVTLAERLGVVCDLPKATDKTNDHQVTRLRLAIEQHAKPGDRVVVLGLSYKPDTNVVEQSQGVALARQLADSGRFVTVYDPLANPTAEAVLGDQVVYAETLEEAIEAGEVIVITTAWKQFAKLGNDILSDKSLLIIDPWRVVDPKSLKSSMQVIYPGRGSLSAESGITKQAGRENSL
jgi:UDPglucose 6-dehydrogenase